MSYKYASGQKAIAICDVCGFQYKLRELKELIVKGNKTNIKACPECWNPDQPQNRLGEFPVEDPQALRNPRPDSAELVSKQGHSMGMGPSRTKRSFWTYARQFGRDRRRRHSNSNYELGDRNENEVKIKREGPQVIEFPNEPVMYKVADCCNQPP
jgi:hypothetical protein